VKIWLALIDTDLTNAIICYFLANTELKRKEGHHHWLYAAIDTLLVEQGETFDWEEQIEANTMMSMCSSHNTTVMRREEDLKTTP
jgi:hypothetical protein